MFRAKRVLVFFLDVVLIAASLSLSFLLRYDFTLPAAQRDMLREGLSVALAAKPIMFAASGMYRSIWRYASLQDAYEILKAVTCSSLVMASVETDLRQVTATLDRLFELARQSDLSGVLQLLRQLVPEFVPRYNFEVAPPFAFQKVRPDLFPPPSQKISVVWSLRVAKQSEGSAA